MLSVAALSLVVAIGAGDGQTVYSADIYKLSSVEYRYRYRALVVQFNWNPYANVYEPDTREYFFNVLRLINEECVPNELVHDEGVAVGQRTNRTCWVNYIFDDAVLRVRGLEQEFARHRGGTEGDYTITIMDQKDGKVIWPLANDCPAQSR